MAGADYLDTNNARLHIASVVREILRGAPSRSGRAFSTSLMDEIRRLYQDIQGLPDAERRCAARHVDWVKSGIVYIWYSLMFAGTSNPRKFGKFVSQCGLSLMDCPWPAANGVLSIMSTKMTAGFDRARFTALFNHMADQTAIEVLGLRNMVTHGRYHGMTNIVMILGAMKECPTFEWAAARMMWPGEFIAFHNILDDLMDQTTHVVNPWGGFGNMIEKNNIRSTQFKSLAKLALDIQSRFMGNTTIASLQSFGTRAIYGKWAGTVDTLMTNYETWVTNHHAAAAIIAGAAAIPNSLVRIAKNAYLTQKKLISFVFLMSFININIVYVLLKPSREILIFSIINFNYKICVFLYCS